MRTAFIQELILQARRNPEIFLIVGDLGYSVVEPFAAEFPDRFLNVGVAEQNMTGVAAGLASEGFHVFTYSIANFPTLRCLEQIRNDICYHKFPVTVVAVGAGMAYGNLGYSHHCVQDIACLRGMPNLTMLSPADPGETVACVKWLSENPGPSYLRLGKAGEPKIHSHPVTFDGPIKVVDRRGKIAIIATGSVLSEAVDASAIVDAEGISCDVYSMIRLAPIGPHEFGTFSTYRGIITVEEHVGPGGLGELIRSRISNSISVDALCVTSGTASRVGTQAVLRQLASIDARTLVDRIKIMNADMLT